jgi:hypothetical protein
MHTPQTIRVGQEYLYPSPVPRSARDYTFGFIKVTVKDIFEDRGGSFVRLASTEGKIEATPNIKDFCEEVNLAKALGAKLA